MTRTAHFQVGRGHKEGEDARVLMLHSWKVPGWAHCDCCCCQEREVGLRRVKMRQEPRVLLRGLRPIKQGTSKVHTC